MRFIGNKNKKLSSGVSPQTLLGGAYDASQTP